MLMAYGIPPIHYERPVWVHDLSIPSTPETESHAWWIGRWDEVRPHTYTTSIFTSDRNVHVGLDLGAPAGTVVRAAFDGRIHSLGSNDAPGDYGPTIITEHHVEGHRFWLLHGHLTRTSLEMWSVGDRVVQSEPLGALGDEEVNGGYPPHLHLQVSLIEPETHDLPGVVTEEDRVEARRHFPDPRCYIGQVYDDGDQGGFRHRFR